MVVRATVCITDTGRGHHKNLRYTSNLFMQMNSIIPDIVGGNPSYRIVKTIFYSSSNHSLHTTTYSSQN
jgi:hypothetical protein